IVVLSANWDFVNPDYDQATRARKLMETIQTIRAAGVRRVVVMGSAPFWKTTVPNLLVDELRRNSSLPMPHRLTRASLQPQNDSWLEGLTLQAGAEFVSVFRNLCDSAGCLVATGNTWRD